MNFEWYETLTHVFIEIEKESDEFIKIKIIKDFISLDNEIFLSNLNFEVKNCLCCIDKDKLIIEMEKKEHKLCINLTK